MNTARIVALTIALCAGGIAAYFASAFDDKQSTVEPVARPQTVDVLVAKSDVGLGQDGALSLALRSIVEANAVENRTDDQALKRGDGLNVVRYGIAIQTTAQK
jgi:Flp pilus assembly protein CpaB